MTCSSGDGPPASSVDGEVDLPEASDLVANEANFPSPFYDAQCTKTMTTICLGRSMYILEMLVSS